jgi:hypothetical protein
VTIPTAPEQRSDPEIPAAAGKQKAKRGLGGYVGGFIALLVLTAACASTSGATIPADSSSSPTATVTASASDTPSPADSSSSPSPSPPSTPASAITTAPNNPPPAPEPSTQAPQPAPSTAQAQSCYPLTNGGGCYKPGEFCRKSDHGATGIDANGDSIKCEDNNGLWRWERI